MKCLGERQLAGKLRGCEDPGCVCNCALFACDCEDAGGVYMPDHFSPLLELVKSLRLSASCPKASTQREVLGALPVPSPEAPLVSVLSWPPVSVHLTTKLEPVSTARSGRT